MLTAPYLHGADGENRYARHDVSPTVVSLEQAIGALEGGIALAFGSGIAATAAVAAAIVVKYGMPAISAARRSE